MLFISRKTKSFIFHYFVCFFPLIVIDLAIIVNLKGRLFLNYGVGVEIYMLPFGKLNSFLS